MHSHKIIYHPLFFSFYCLIILFCYFFVDQRTADFFHSHLSPSMHHFFKMLTQLGRGEIYFVLLPAGFLFFRFICRRPQLARAFLFLLAGLLIAAIICSILKIAFSRARPYEWLHFKIYGFYFINQAIELKNHFPFLHLNTYFMSFPSGHATNITALMAGLSCIKPRYSWFFILIAIMICATRVILTDHYVSDVMAGFYLSLFCIEKLYHYYMRRT